MREIRSSGSVGGGHPAQLNVRQVPPIPILSVFVSYFCLSWLDHFAMNSRADSITSLPGETPVCLYSKTDNSRPDPNFFA
jgi:hypothetical protein